MCCFCIPLKISMIIIIVFTVLQLVASAVAGLWIMAPLVGKIVVVSLSICCLKDKKCPRVSALIIFVVTTVFTIFVAIAFAVLKERIAKMECNDYFKAKEVKSLFGEDITRD